MREFLEDFLEMFEFWFIRVISGIAGFIFLVAPFALAVTLSVFFSPWFMFLLFSIAIFWPISFAVLENLD